MLERVVVCSYRLLGVTSFVLKVMSWSGNNVPIYLYKMNVIFCHSCPVKRGQSLKAQLSLEMSHPGKAETDLIWQVLQGRFPHSAQLASFMKPGTQHNRPCLRRLSK